MPSLSLLHVRRVSRSLRPQSASCSILALRSPYACFYLILAILNYFNLSSVFILNFHAFYSLLYFNFFCLILTDAAPTCLECPRGRVAVYREGKNQSRLQRRSNLKMFTTDGHRTSDACIYYKLTYEPSTSSKPQGGGYFKNLMAWVCGPNLEDPHPIHLSFFLSILSRLNFDHHLRCGGWLNFEFS